MEIETMSEETGPPRNALRREESLIAGNLADQRNNLPQTETEFADLMANPGFVGRDYGVDGQFRYHALGEAVAHDAPWNQTDAQATFDHQRRDRQTVAHA